MRARWFSITVAVVMAVVFIAPTIVVVGSSFSDSSFISFPPEGFSLRWYDDVFGDPQWMRAFGNSVAVGLLAAALAIVVGTLLAMGAARSRILPSAAVTGLAVIPIVVPSVVLGVGFYIVAVNLGFTGSVVGLALAHAALGAPYVFVGVLAALTSVDRSTEEAARVSGATQLGAFLRVTVPAIAPAALVGGLLAFITSWDEVIVAGFMTSPSFRTLPVLIFAQVRTGADPSTSAVATVVTVFSLLLMLVVGGVSALLARRRRLAATKARADDTATSAPEKGSR
ncbi:ABC transporter permease [Herbiconiux moechotypicola]|uniref:ABC transporter permease n=1 Tax=Herbiconiux moechotypicola TaxID=637393 RepID=A0ABP5QFD3_9MICO|nr:ABC transporter permease [Herbiconiux moechotypicola]MCS5730001.1 ABC transporter permease [Herbiconiux moechotypicola]